MKDISLSRHYLPALVFTSLIALAALLPFTADAQPLASSAATAASPYVGTASAKAMYRQYAIKERQHEVHGSADLLATPLAQIRTSRAAAMARLHPHATDTADTVSSTVQTEDFTLPLEDVDSSGNDIAPANLVNTGANIDPTWFPDESFICYSSNRSDGYYHLFALPATGIDTSDATAATKLAAREAQVSQLTSDSATAPRNERWPSFASTSQVAYCQSYGTSATGPYSLIIAPLSTNSAGLPVVNQTQATTLIQASGTAGAIASVEHPVYFGNVIIFSAIINGQSTYHLFEYTLSNSTITQLTGSTAGVNADEENPSVISTPAPNSQSVIVFDSTATGYPSNSTTLPLDASGVSTTGQRNIFAITTSGTEAVKVTDSATANSIEPSLGYVTANQATGIGEGVHLFFSSNRIGGHYNIYDLPITIPANGSQAIVAGESTLNPASIVLTSDPQAADTAATPEPVGGYDNLEPAAPPFNNFNTILYASARYLVNGIGDNPVSNAVSRYGETPPTTDFQGTAVDTELQPENTTANPAGIFAAAGTFAAETQTLNPTGSFEIFSSHDADIDAPSLLRYSSSEVIHITTSDDAAAADVRQPGTQQTIYFFVRLSDRQTGVGNAYLQIKDPNSIYQQGSGIEHKVFTKDTSVVEPSADALLHPYYNTANPDGNEASKLYSGPAVGGYVIPSAIAQPIYMGNLRQATPSGYAAPDQGANLLAGYTYANQGASTATYYRGGPIASFTVASPTTLTVIGTDQLETIYSYRPPNGQPTFNNDGSVQNFPTATNGYALNTPLNSYDLAGCTLDLYNSGGVYTETVQVVRDAETTVATATAPQTGTLTVTPVAGTYTPATMPVGKGTGATLYGPPLASAAGYAVIHQVGYFDPQGQEVDAEAIQAGTGALIDASNPANFTIPPYVPSIDDGAPYSAEAAPTDPANGNKVWVTLSPVGPDPTNGGVIYEGSWQTPKQGSDWYIDAIAYDNALDNIPNSPSDGKAVNWRIYDNIWGFSTTPFSASTTKATGGILLVNDYMLPQKFLTQTVADPNVSVALYGSESYLTDVDVNPQDFGNAQQLASLPDAGYTNDPNTMMPSLTLSLIYHRTSDAGYANAPFYPNGLGINSYTDGQQNTVATITPPTFPIQAPANGYASIMLGAAYPTSTPVPPSQNYDIWRILCRGPIPASIVNDYSPTVINQHADITNNQPAKTVLSAPSCVIWSAPLAGEEFADSGTIADPNTQALLETFVNGGVNSNITFQGGGRLYVEGTTVGFSTSADTNFYKGLLGASYGGQTGANNASTFTLSGATNRTDYISNDAYINNDGNNAIVVNNGVGHGNFKATLSGTAFDIVPNWAYNPPGVTALTQLDGTLIGTTSLQLAFLDPAGIGFSTDSRSDSSLIDGGSSGIIFIDTYADANAAPMTTTTGGVLPDTTAQASELAGTSGNRLSYTSFAPPAIASPVSGSTATTVASGSGIVAYSSFGLESVSQNVRAILTLLSSTGTKPPDDPAFTVDNQRSDLIHNLVCFLRTGSIQGVVTVGNGTTGGGGGTVTPLANALVSASIQPLGGVDVPDQTYTAVTGSNGAFTIRGLPAGKYGLTGYAAGYSFSQTNGTGVYVHGGDVGTDNFQAEQTQPGSLSVTVLDPNTSLGVGNVTVTAYEAGSYGQVADMSYTGVTGASGTTTINNVPTGTYYVVATPPAGTTYSVTDYVVVGGSTNVTIGTSTFTPVSVTASTTTSITIDLNAALATISGTVTNASGTAISGATVTFTNTRSTGTSPASVTTAADGTYSVANVQPGTYIPTATFTGYMTDTLSNLTVASGQAVTGENFTLSPPSYGTIEGAVEDANGNLVSGVTVTLTPSSPAASATTGTPFADATTPTNNDNVEFTGIVYGTYTVTAESALGNVMETVTLNAADVTFPTIQLPSVHAFTYPAGDTVDTLQMISAPYDYTNTGDTLSELFGYTDPKITTWEPAINQYATPGVSPADTLHLGVGYWVRFPANENLLIAGTPTNSNTFSIPLTQGWNMIGEPFVDANVPVSSLQVTVGKNNYSFAQAISQQLQLLGPTLYTYAPGDSAYESIGSSGTINQYQGYWIHALTGVTLVLTRP